MMRPSLPSLILAADRPPVRVEQMGTDIGFIHGGRRQTAVRLQELTKRQNQIVELVTAGASNREIAQTLGVAEGTVKVHLHTIFERLGVASRTELSRKSSTST